MKFELSNWHVVSLCILICGFYIGCDVIPLWQELQNKNRVARMAQTIKLPNSAPKKIHSQSSTDKRTSAELFSNFLLQLNENHIKILVLKKNIHNSLHLQIEGKLANIFSFLSRYEHHGIEIRKLIVHLSDPVSAEVDLKIVSTVGEPLPAQSITFVNSMCLYRPSSYAQFSSQQMRLAGVVHHTKGNIAILQLPNSSLMEVEIGQRLGLEHARVTDITVNSITIDQRILTIS